MTLIGSITRSTGTLRNSLKAGINMVRIKATVPKAQDRSESNLTSIYGKYNSHLHPPEKNRYVVKDKSPVKSSCEAFADIKRPVENAYFLLKSGQEKRRCFENIQNIQNYCYRIKRKNNMLPQTKYNPEDSTLWKRVKDMYASTRNFIDPEKLYEVENVYIK